MRVVRHRYEGTVVATSIATFKGFFAGCSASHPRENRVRKGVPDQHYRSEGRIDRSSRRI